MCGIGGECETGPITIVASMASYKVSSGRFRTVLVRRRGTLAVGSLLGSGTKAVGTETARPMPPPACMGRDAPIGLELRSKALCRSQQIFKWGNVAQQKSEYLLLR